MKFIIYLSFLLSFSQTFAESSLCPFCTNQIENQIVLETPHLRLILDHAPYVKGHLLIIPKRHVPKAHELSKEEWAEFSELIPRIVQVFEKVFHTDQYLILEKNGPNAFQTVPHVHFHILPMPIKHPWLSIFRENRPILSNDEIKKEVDFYRSYFFEAI